MVNKDEIMEITEIKITPKNNGFELTALYSETKNGKVKIVDDPNFRYWARSKDACFQQLKELMSDWK